MIIVQHQCLLVNISFLIHDKSKIIFRLLSFFDIEFALVSMIDCKVNLKIM